MSKYFKYAAAAILFVPGLAAAHGPSRLKYETSIEVNAPAAKAWDVIKNFCAIGTWLPPVKKVECKEGNKVGTERDLWVGKTDGKWSIQEFLLKYEPEKMMYKYKIENADPKAFPVDQYASFLGVTDEGNGKCKVYWRAGFYRFFTQNDPPKDQDDDAAMAAVKSVYKVGLEQIKKLAEGGK